MQKLSLRRRFVAFATGSLFIAGISWSCLSLAQGMPDNQLMFELLNRIEQLEREMRQLRGDLEMYRYSQENANRRLQALEKQLDGNISTPNRTPNRSESAYTTVPGESADTSPGASEQSSSRTNQSTALNKQPGFGSSSATEQAVYDAAIDRLREGNYERAIEGFQQFLREYPTSSLAGNAQYWLGEAYYVNRDFAKSRQAFIAMGTNFPDSRRLPDAMLKLAYVYEALNEKDKARQVLQKLVQTYPRTQAANLAENRLQSLR